MNTYFINWAIIQHYFKNFCYSTHSSFGHWEIFYLVPWSLTSSQNYGFIYLFWEHPYFLALKDTSGSSVILLISVLELESFMVIWYKIRNCDLGTRYAHYYYGVIYFRLSQLTEKGNTFLYNHEYTYSSKFVYM